MTSINKDSITPPLPPEDEWRAHGSHKKGKTEYVSISIFQPGDKVWYNKAGEGRLIGPCTVLSHQGNETYIIKDESNGQQIPGVVSKADLQRA